MKKTKRTRKRGAIRKNAAFASAIAQLTEWVAARKTISMGFYGHFFVATIEGHLHHGDDRGKFDFAGLQNRFVSRLQPEKCETVALVLFEGLRAVTMEFGAERIMLVEKKSTSVPVPEPDASKGPLN